MALVEAGIVIGRSPDGEFIGETIPIMREVEIDSDEEVVDIADVLPYQELMFGLELPERALQKR